jgi:hypothetical protein
MTLLDQIPCFSIFLLVFGLLLVASGLKILKDRKYYSIARDDSLQHWGKPVLVDGRRARLRAIGYLILGSFFILLGLVTFQGISY